jgi:hypothetical protein
MKTATCQNCSKEFSYSEHQSRGKYCSNLCAGEHKSRLRKESWFRKEVRCDRATIRKYLSEERGYKCEVCGLLGEWQGKKLTLQVDHIDGNPGDDSPGNLRLI